MLDLIGVRSKNHLSSRHTVAVKTITHYCGDGGCRTNLYVLLAVEVSEINNSVFGRMVNVFTVTVKQNCMNELVFRQSEISSVEFLLCVFITSQMCAILVFQYNFIKQNVFQIDHCF